VRRFGPLEFVAQFDQERPHEGSSEPHRCTEYKMTYYKKMGKEFHVGDYYFDHFYIIYIYSNFIVCFIYISN